LVSAFLRRFLRFVMCMIVNYVVSTVPLLLCFILAFSHWVVQTRSYEVAHMVLTPALAFFSFSVRLRPFAFFFSCLPFTKTPSLLDQGVISSSVREVCVGTVPVRSIFLPGDGDGSLLDLKPPIPVSLVFSPL